VNRSAPGFVVGVQYIDYPFKTDSISVNLAMSKFSLSSNGQYLNVEGSFSEIERYKTMDYNYAMGRDAAKAAVASAEASVKEEEKKESKDSGLGWRG
jgi:hypothetical protein